MPLTPEDVSNKRFTPVRLREGYDMGEVDQFLDEIEAELARLLKENDDLRAKVVAAQAGAPAAAPVPAPEPERELFVAEPEPEPEPEPAPVPVATGIETLRVETVPDASNVATRLLEIASRNAEELVEEAKTQADAIVGAAKAKTERLEAEARAAGEKIESDARARAAMVDAEAEQRRRELFGNLERDRDKLAHDVDNLRSFEREYRSRLKSYFNQQLESLNQMGESTPPAASDTAAPKRLRTILGEDGS